MARTGVQVNLANRIKRVANYTELYLCKKLFSYVCYDFDILKAINGIGWRSEYGSTVATKKNEWLVNLTLQTTEVRIYSKYVSISVLGSRSTINFNENLRRLYCRLDFNSLYWCVREEIRNVRRNPTYFDH